jgi:3-isopropylmalate/(R)-2-methylmalate dehydratase small subunit
MKTFDGQVLFLDRSDINTDEIIPARYLTEITKAALKPHLLEDLNLEEFDPTVDLAGKRVIITRANFGCGSSREHAPWALEVNDINLVIAPNFARIFRQNMFNCGMMAVELPEAQIDAIFTRFGGKPAQVRTDFDANRLTIRAGEDELTVPFTISDFDRALVQAGGWVDYADTHY